MDHLPQRLDALEQQVQSLTRHTHTVSRRLRWWRGLACGVVVLAGLTWALPVVTAADAKKSLEERVAALEDLLKHFTRDGNNVRITGANLRIVNGLGATGTTNSLGNLIVGYNEPREEGENIRTGSHNVVVGQWHNFSRFGGLVVGRFNEISGDFAVVSGGQRNTASGHMSSVSGGENNTASGGRASVSGGVFNTAEGDAWTSVSGGEQNRAIGGASSISGGIGNIAESPFSTVSGGSENIAGELASAVSGGRANKAFGRFSAVSGGLNRTAEGEFDWVAGSLFEDE